MSLLGSDNKTNNAQTSTAATDWAEVVQGGINFKGGGGKTGSTSVWGVVVVVVVMLSVAGFVAGKIFERGET